MQHNTANALLHLKMFGSPKSQKVGLRQVALKSDVDGENGLILPPPFGRKEGENIGIRKLMFPYNPLELSFML